MRALYKYKIIVLFLFSCFANSLYAGQKIKIETNNQKVVLSIGSIHYFFTQQGKMWALSHGNDSIQVYVTWVLFCGEKIGGMI